MVEENEYIEKGKDSEEKEMTAKGSKKSKKGKSKRKKRSRTFKFPFVDKIREKLADRKIRTTIGMILTLLSVYTLLANFSYLLTWTADQDRVIGNGLIEFLFDGNDVPVENWLGKFGAWISHLMMYRWFGVASFSICLILFVSGFNLLFNLTILPIRRTFVVGLLSMVWLSLLFGSIAVDINWLGGSFGYQLNSWLNVSLGKVGTVTFILAIGYLLSIILFNINFGWIFRFFSKKAVDSESELEKTIDPDDMVVVNTISEESIVEEQESEVIDLTEKDNLENIIENTLEEIEPNLSTSEINDTLITSSETPINEEDFAIEVAEEKEEDKSLSEEEVDSHQKDFGDYDPTLDLSSYLLPPIELLKDYKGTGGTVDKQELEDNKNKIVETLANYKIEISKIRATVGPTVTLYEIIPAPGVRISKIKNLEDDIALSLAALGIRIIAPIPGKGTIGIEVPNSNPDMVSMRSLIASKKFQESDHELPVVLGKTITNETFTFDLTKMPHLLVAGATGQGKSVGLNAILVSILYKKHPAQVKFVLVDPKKVELTLYNKIERHFLAKLPDEEDAIITDTSKVVNTLNSLTIEMDERYELLKTAQCRTIKEYNAKFIARKLNPEKGHKYLPYIVVLIDEFADLIMTAGKEVEQPIARIAQLARAIGIHLIVATQRPSVNVITGMIKANFPARIAFRVLSKIDSRTILDASGADQLIGRGDMLISTGQDMVRLQCGFVDTPEVEDICDFIGEQRGYSDALLLPEYVGESADGGGSIDDDELDALFADAARIVVMHQQGSASLLQRKLKLGYNRAGRIVDQLEGMGIIGAFKGSKARDVLYSDEQALEEFLASKGLV